MKQLKWIFAALALVAFTFGAQAQQKTKFGHIDTNELMQVIPGRKDAETKLQDYAKQLEAQLQAMSVEYQNKVTEFQNNEKNYDNVIKMTKAKEIGQLEQRITEFQQSAQESLGAKESELMQPLIDKAKTAINEVAAEQGYTYVIDSSVGVLLVSPDSDDLLPAVKTKLGIN